MHTSLCIHITRGKGAAGLVTSWTPRRGFLGSIRPRLHPGRDPMILHAFLIGAPVGVNVGSLAQEVALFRPRSSTSSAKTRTRRRACPRHRGPTAAVSLATRARSGSVAWREGTIFALAGPGGHGGGSGAGPARAGPDPAVLLRLPGGRDFHEPAPSCTHPPRLRRTRPGKQLRGQRSWTPLATVGRVVAPATLDGFPHGFFGVGGGHDRACPTPRAAIPDEARLGHIPAGHGHHGCSFGFTQYLRNLTINVEAGAMVALFAGASMLGGFVGLHACRIVSSAGLLPSSWPHQRWAAA